MLDEELVWLGDGEATGADVEPEWDEGAGGANIGAGGSIAFEGTETGCATEGATVITFVAVGEEEFGATSDIGRIVSFKSEARDVS